MNEQLTIPDNQMLKGILPDGAEIKPGDIVKYSYPGAAGFTRIVLIDGKLCMEENFFMGHGTPIADWIKQASYYRIEKVSLTDIYRFCKKHDWDTQRYILKCGRRD